MSIGYPCYHDDSRSYFQLNWKFHEFINFKHFHEFLDIFYKNAFLGATQYFRYVSDYSISDS